MQVCADLRPTGAQLAQDGCGPLPDGDLIRGKVGRSHAQPPAQGVEAWELADVLDRHAVAARLPVVFFGIDGDDQQDRS